MTDQISIEEIEDLMEGKHDPLCDHSHGLRCNCIKTQLRDALRDVT